MAVDRKRLRTLVGKQVYVLMRDGQMVSGILDKVTNDRVYLRRNTKQATTSAFFSPIIPLVLFDLLAIAEAPFFFGAPFCI